VKHQDVAADCDFDAFIAAARDPGPVDTYRSHSPVLTAEWQRLRDRHGESGVDQFNAMLMCRAIAHSVDRMESLEMPELLKEEYVRNYERILDRTESATGAALHLSTDLVAKDLGLCTQRLFAAGYAIIEIRHSMAKRNATMAGVRQFVDFLSLYYLKFGGKGPFLSNHFHPELASLFTKEGRIHSFRLIATIMDWHPVHKALIGSAWFYDPVLEDISPNLTYVRDYPEKNGALFFRGAPDHSGTALVSSKRRDLYDRGEYQPRKYLMVWPRDTLVEWLHREFPSR
jgi:hypothetical protein